jgi:hypothetical protein
MVPRPHAWLLLHVQLALMCSDGVKKVATETEGRIEVSEGVKDEPPYSQVVVACARRRILERAPRFMGRYAVMGVWQCEGARVAGRASSG